MNILPVLTNGYDALEVIVWIMVVLTTLAIFAVVLGRKTATALTIALDVAGLTAVLLAGIGMLSFWFYIKGWI